MPGRCRRDRIGKPALEFVVRTELDHLKVAVQLDWRSGGGSPVSKKNLVVFEFKGPVRLEAVLDTYSSQPAGAGVGPLPSDARKVQRGIALHPGAAELAVDKPTVLREADAASDRPNP